MLPLILLLLAYRLGCKSVYLFVLFLRVLYCQLFPGPCMATLWTNLSRCQVRCTFNLVIFFLTCLLFIIILFDLLEIFKYWLTKEEGCDYFLYIVMYFYVFLKCWASVFEFIVCIWLFLTARWCNLRQYNDMEISVVFFSLVWSES